MLEVLRPETGVAVVRLSRPEQLNALTLELLDDLRRVLDELDADDDCRCIVLTGAGSAFSAGLDLTVLTEPDARHMGGPEAGMRLQERAVAGLLAPRRVATPVVAAINGLALGGGLSLALASDLRICGTRATFVPGFQKLGLTGTDVGVSWLLPRIVGASMAFDLMLTSRRLDAHEALGVGLVSRVVEGDVQEAGVRVAAEVAALGPFAMRLTKQVMWANLAQPDLAAAIELENRNQVLALQTDDHQEGLRAVIEKRAAVFTGR